MPSCKEHSKQPQISCSLNFVAQYSPALTRNKRKANDGASTPSQSTSARCATRPANASARTACYVCRSARQLRQVARVLCSVAPNANSAAKSESQKERQERRVVVATELYCAAGSWRKFRWKCKRRRSELEDGPQMPTRKLDSRALVESIPSRKLQAKNASSIVKTSQV